MHGIRGVAWRPQIKTQNHNAPGLSTSRRAMVRTSQTVLCRPPQPQLFLHVAALQKPRSWTGLILAFKASRRHSSSETMTCPPPALGAAAGCSWPHGPLARSGCLAEARERRGPPPTTGLWRGQLGRGLGTAGGSRFCSRCGGQWELRRGLSRHPWAPALLAVFSCGQALRPRRRRALSPRAGH